MAYSSQDLTQVETAIIRLASGNSVVRVTIGDKTVEFRGQGWCNPHVIGFKTNPSIAAPSMKPSLGTSSNMASGP
jgi:hypothetical protein